MENLVRYRRYRDGGGGCIECAGRRTPGNKYNKGSDPNNAKWTKSDVSVERGKEE